MKFLVDAQLPPALAIWLQRQGLDAAHVFQLHLGAEPDPVIASHAEAIGAVLISKDADFVTLRLPDRFGFVWLRCGNATTRALFAWLKPRWPEIRALLEAGEQLIEVR